MNSIEKLKKAIRGRTCCVISKGKSVEELEQKIEMFRDKNICWVIQNRCDYIEDAILRKIGETVDIVSDCATVSKIEIYEPEVRFPRFYDYFMRGTDGILATSELVLEQCLGEVGRHDVRETFNKKIVTIDKLFAENDCDPIVWDKPPNSFTLLLAFLIAGQAKKIIVFGLDGARTGQKILESYYNTKAVTGERRLAFGDDRPGSVVGDGKDFIDRWERIFQAYKTSFNNQDVEIFNCSPITIFNTFKKITYDQILGEL